MVFLANSQSSWKIPIKTAVQSRPAALPQHPLKVNSPNNSCNTSPAGGHGRDGRGRLSPLGLQFLPPLRPAPAAAGGRPFLLR